MKKTTLTVIASACIAHLAMAQLPNQPYLDQMDQPDQLTTEQATHLFDILREDVHSDAVKQKIEWYSDDKRLSEEFGFRLKENGNLDFFNSNIEEGESFIGTLDVYPNPVQKNFTISGEAVADGRLSLKILDPTGKVVENLVQSDLSAGKFSINASTDLASGNYLLHAEINGKSTTTTKITIVNQ